MACQNQTMLSNVESRSPVRRSARNLLTESKVSELSTAELTSKTWGDGDLIAFESAREDESRYANCLANVLRQLDRTERRGGGKWSHQVVRSKGMSCGI